MIAGPADSPEQDVPAVGTRRHRDDRAVGRRRAHGRQPVAARRLPAALVVGARLARRRCPRYDGRCPRDGRRRRRGRRAGHDVADVRGAERSTQAEAGVLVRRRRDGAITGACTAAAAAAAVAWQRRRRNENNATLDPPLHTRSLLPALVLSEP